VRHDLAQIYWTHHHHVHGSQPLIAILSTIVQLQVEAGAMKRMNSNKVAKNFELRNLLAQNFYLQKCLWRFWNLHEVLTRRSAQLWTFGCSSRWLGHVCSPRPGYSQGIQSCCGAETSLWRASFDHRCPKMKMSLPYDHFNRRHLDMMQPNLQLILSASFLLGIHVCPC
jgi:hypothetical protein